MDNITITEPTGKRARNASVNLTERMCEKRVTKRVKIYDRKCPGLYVSITTAGVATFSFKFTDPETGKQRTGWLGVYNPETFTVENARSQVYGLRGKGAAAIAETFRDRKVRQAKRGKTVDETIEERIAWMKTPVRKPDGEMRPRIETWENVASHLRRFISPRLGKKIARARRSPARSPSTTSQRFRTISSLESWAFHRSPMPATCAAPPQVCSTGRRKQAATT
jgi:hypothetical protein